MCSSTRRPCFSALQRAENSSIIPTIGGLRLVEGFQCSSASRKFLNLSSLFRTLYPRLEGFSALQRAENSSIRCGDFWRCPSCRFSALQRAENSSMSRIPRPTRGTSTFQCSSASRKFLNVGVVYANDQYRAFQCSSASRKFLNFTCVDVENFGC